MTDESTTADLEKRLRQLAASTDAKAILCVRWNEPTGLPDWTPFGATESLSDKLTEAADALSSLTRKLEGLREEIIACAEPHSESDVVERVVALANRLSRADADVVTDQGEK